MRRKNRHKQKPNISLAHRRKYRFVTPDEDIRALWNPGNYIAKYASLLLRDFIPYSDSLEATPSEFCHGDEDESEDISSEENNSKDYQQWHDCLEEMLFAFEFFANEYNQLWMADEETKRRVQHGLDLFAKYYDHLWV